MNPDKTEIEYFIHKTYFALQYLVWIHFNYRDELSIEGSRRDGLSIKGFRALLFNRYV